jgi:hypothetical protein
MPDTFSRLLSAPCNYEKFNLWTGNIENATIELIPIIGKPGESRGRKAMGLTPDMVMTARLPKMTNLFLK